MQEIDRSLRQTEAAHTSGAYFKRPLTLVRGAGTRVWDDSGRSFLDATSGQGVALTGHAHPVVTAAIAKQAGELVTSPEIFFNEHRALLYERLTDLTPGDIGRFFLCNSGAEAMEGALKVAMLLTGRNKVLATRNAFHGRTLGALALTWNPKYRQPFDAWHGDQVQHLAFNDLEAARAAIDGETAAAVVEVVQGEGGVRPADAAWLHGLRQLCDDHGALLVIDEIQTGLGRCGSWFACQQADVVPDILALGKGLAGGVPIGAVCWRASLGNLPAGSHGSTFGGNPLACAAALATLAVIEDEHLPQRAAQLGNWIMSELAGLQHPSVREVRGLGLLVGMQLRGRVTPVLKRLQDRGVLALPAGFNVLRLLPPLIISEGELKEIVVAIRESLDD
ncbi:MAG: aspartate aminotransferase family protein [Anaerolineaceae bacterium]|nr:aspartate aminotransferase family protein [Anaerolineaceae bacterium]